MPLFEYMCVRCGNTFEQLVRSSTQEIVCPRCKGTRVQKQMSSFAVRGTGGQNRGAGAPAAACAPGGG
jgi:putative FmdB family regulatory protein